MAEANTTEYTPSDDLAWAVATLRAKTELYTTYYRYYEGRQPLVYSTDRLREVFSALGARFTQNWCAVVVDSALERIQLQNITVAEDESATASLSTILQDADLVAQSDNIHRDALVAGEGYAIAWPDEDTGDPDLYHNDPRTVHLFYEAARPRVKRYGCKWWLGDDGHRYLTLYYPDHLEYYRTRRRVRATGESGTMMLNEPATARGYEPLGEAPNPYGVVPIFHFRRDRAYVSSELQNLVEPQDAINKLLADMMIVAEFGAFPQRYIISSGEPGKFKNAPNQIWDVPGGDGEGQPTSVGQFAAAELNNYLEAIHDWTSAIAIISRTPKHYFDGQDGTPSGEALIAMEAPLNKKTQKYIDRFTVTWSEVAEFLLRVQGTAIERAAIVPHFDKPETVQPYTQALITKEYTAAGVPLLWQMEQAGYTEQEIADLEAARQQEQRAAQARLAESMVNARRNFDRGGMEEDEEQ